MVLAGFSMGSFLQAGAALADEVEIAELPPPYVPALFGVVLIAGVGLLTSSLGDVMTEGSLRYSMKSAGLCLCCVVPLIATNVS